MKKLSIVLSLAISILCFTAISAFAIPISGSISFGGNPVLDDFLADADQVTAINNAHVTDSSGAYSVIPDYYGLPVSTPPVVTFSGFIFDPITTPVYPLWRVDYNSIIYEFEAITMTLNTQNANFLDISGTGEATISGGGYEKTGGTWSFNINQATGSATFGFSSNTAVPEPASILLVGFGLVGLAGFSRKLKK